MQELVVFLLFAASVAYLGRHWWKASCGQGGCGSCKSCPSSQKADEVQLIQIDLGPRAK